VGFEIKGIAFGAVTSGGLTAVCLKVHDFWDVTVCGGESGSGSESQRGITGLLDLEDEGIMILRNVGNYSSNNSVTPHTTWILQRNTVELGYNVRKGLNILCRYKRATL
jgi:hypothetical protein